MRCLIVVDLDGVVLRAAGFGAEAAGLRGIEAKIAHEVLSGLGDVLSELGDEIQGLKDLEIAGDPRTAAEEVGTGAVGEALRGVLLGEVKDRALLGAWPGSTRAGCWRMTDRSFDFG